MTRLFTDGAEFGDALFWSTIGDCIASTTYKRAGVYSYKLSYCGKALADMTEFYLRAGILYAPLYNEESFTMISFRYDARTLLSIKYNQYTGSLQLWRGRDGYGEILLDTATIPLRRATWYLLEVHVLVHGTTGEFEIKLDGIVAATFSGDTIPETDSVINNIYFTSVGSTSLYLDDLALNDVNGGVDDAWCGDGYIELIVPNADTATVEWTPSAVVDHYTLVAEIPSDGDTTYVEDSTPGNQDIYELTNIVTAGKLIERVWVEARAKDTSATSQQMKLGLETGALPFLSGALTLLASYDRVIGPDYIINPDTAIDWTPAEVNLLKSIIETV
jgi:hypothetical protein